MALSISSFIANTIASAVLSIASQSGLISSLLNPDVTKLAKSCQFFGLETPLLNLGKSSNPVK